MHKNRYIVCHRTQGIVFFLYLAIRLQEYFCWTNIYGHYLYSKKSFNRFLFQYSLSFIHIIAWIQITDDQHCILLSNKMEDNLLVVYLIFSVMCMFCRSLFVHYLPFFFCPLCCLLFLYIHGFWLPLWYLQTLLTITWYLLQDECTSLSFYLQYDDDAGKRRESWYWLPSKWTACCWITTTTICPTTTTTTSDISSTRNISHTLLFYDDAQ